MLTDYHLHLRPDDLEATAAVHFTDENLRLYLEAASEAGVGELGVSEHVHRFRDALSIWDHPFWRENAVDDLASYCEWVRTTPLRLGIEMDFVPGREDKTARLLDEFEFDYVVGSVHFLGDVAVDHEGYDAWRAGAGPDEIWRRYFEHLAEAARSRLFDVLAHPDLVKVWGSARPLPERDPRHYYEPAVEAIAESGIAVEISTAGLRKPVGELYPGPALLEMCVDAGCRFSLSSDAHVPEHVGYGYDEAIEVMRGAGIGEIAVFDRRRRELKELG